MLKQRLIYGPIMIALLVAVFYFDNRLDRVAIADTWLQPLFFGREYLPRGLIMLVAVLVLIAAAAGELCGIFRSVRIEADRFMVALAGMTGCALMYAMPHDVSSQNTMAVFATLIIVLFLLTLLKYSWGQRRTDGAVAVAAVTMLALIYLGLLPGFLIAIRRWYSAWVVAGILLITKSSDIGAYATGMAIGRSKLIPWLSPGKTWEGLVGGMVLSTLTAVVLAAACNQWQIAGVYEIEQGQRVFVPNHFDLYRSAVAGLLIGLFGQFGDLVASLFKRDAGIKDSGRTIPGFGGLLDIVDSPVVVAPLAYWLLVLGTGLD